MLKISGVVIPLCYVVNSGEGTCQHESAHKILVIKAISVWLVERAEVKPKSQEVKKTFKIATAVVVSLILVGFFLSIYITVDEKIPDNAVVVVTLEDKLYHSIHFDYICVAGKTAKTMVLAEAKEKGFKQDPHCQDLGYFSGNTLFLYQAVLSKFGVQYNSRWDKAGDWLW